MKLRVQRAAPPALSAIKDWYPGADLLDSFAVALPPTGYEDLSRLTLALFKSPPAWTRGLLRLRDRLVSPLGLKTTAEIRKAGATDGRDRIGFFPVLGRSPNEIVLGEDDTHLDFRISVFLQNDEHTGSRLLVLTTAVRCHNLLGRAYLQAIKPFHVLIVQSNLSRLTRQRV